MTTLDAGDAVANAANPTVETVEKAAAELARLFKVFDESAVDLTHYYIEQRLAGEEGATWVRFPNGFRGRPTAILDPIMRHAGAILLDAGYNMWGNLLNKYKLTKVTMLLPGDEGTFVKAEAIAIRRARKGHDPGDEYLVVDDRIFKAGHDHKESVPTVGGDGKLAWSTPRDRVNSTFHPLTEVDDALLRVIKSLRAYEPAVAPTV